MEYATRFMKAKIHKCSSADYWYSDKIGKTILIREFAHSSAFVECKNGFTALKIDLDYIGNPKNYKK